MEHPHRNRAPTSALDIFGREQWARLGQNTATLGFILYSAFAPHSIAAAEISLAIVGASWLVRSIASGTTGLRRTPFDLAIWLFFLWTVASSLLSQEPRISIAKLQSACVFLLFYLTGNRYAPNGRAAGAVMILSGA